MRANLCSSVTPCNCYCSVTKPCQTLCDPMNCSTPGFLVFHCLPEFAQTHVHWITTSHYIASHWQIWDLAYSVWLNDGPQRCPCPESVNIWQKSVCGCDWVRWRSNPVLFVLFTEYDFTFMKQTKKKPCIWIHMSSCWHTQGSIHVQKDLQKHSMLQTLFFSLTLFTFFFTVLYTVVFCCWVTKSCPTPCDPTDWIPPGSSVCGISQARILEWVGYFLLYVLYCSDGPSVTTMVL